MRRTGRASYALITLAVLVVVAAATALLVRSRGDNASQAQRLARAVETLRYRPTEARLVGLPFAPRQRVTRGSPEGDLRLRAASVLASEHTTPRLEATTDLILGRTARAVDILRAATDGDPNDARAWSDYAAALIEHGINERHAESFALALAAADTALQIDSTLPEANFNRAVALERLELWSHAADAYRHYLTVEHASGWRREAIERQQRLQIPTAATEWEAAIADLKQHHDLGRFLPAAARHPQQARMWAEGECLVLWAEAFADGRAGEADRWLASARAIGSELARTGEPFVADVVAKIDRAGADDRKRLARGHASYGKGRLAYHKRRVAEAAPHFDDAIAQFHAARSPMKLVAMYFRANVAFDQNDAERALALLDATDAEAADRYVAFRAQTRWQRGTIYARAGRTYESLAAYTAAADDFALRGERENAARMRLYAATLLSYLGRASDAWSARVAAYRETSLSGNHGLLESALNTAGRAELRERRWNLARSLFSLQLQPPNSNERLRFDALLWRAYAGMNCTPATAAPDFGVIRAAAAAIPDAALREDAQNDAREAEAYAIAQRQPARSLDLLEETLAYRQRNRHFTHIARAHTEIAKLQRTQGRPDAALEHLLRAIERREEQRAGVASDDLRDAFFHADTAPYGIAVEMLVERGLFAQAFDVAERMRARLLVDRLRHGHVADPMSAADVQAQLRNDDTILQIITTDTATSLLIASRDALRGIVIRRDLRPLVNSDAPRAARELFDLLVAPALRDRPGTKTLVIVPDDATDAVPFAALRASDNRYLVELATIVVPPSATTFLLARSAQPAGERGRSLFVGDPRFDRTLFPNLPRLAGAEQEARGLVRLHPNALVLTDGAATEARVREAVPTAPLIHIAAHAVTHRDDPRQSVVPLADDGDGGLLYLSEIAALPLRERPLVVLNGCQTGAASNGAAGSVRSLASAFLLAGARSVVATLWDIDDGHARRLSVAFHEHLTRGEPVASALRSAQLQMLRSPNPSLRDPRFWSAFQTYGSDQ